MFALGCILILVFGLGGAFSISVRKAIGRRANWTCEEEGCEKSYQDGYWVEAAHYSHDKSNPNYDTVDGGRILCKDHHADSHYNNDDPYLTPEENEWAGDQISARDSRTRWWRKENG